MTKINGEIWEKWQARAAASPTLTKRQWWETLKEEEQAFFRELNEQMGPLQFMGARKNESQKR